MPGKISWRERLCDWPATFSKSGERDKRRLNLEAAVLEGALDADRE